MKIGYILQQSPELRRPPFDGPANHVRAIIAAWQRRGHEVRVLAGLEGRIWRSDDAINFQPVDLSAFDRGLPRLAERSIRRVQSLLNLPYLNYFESRRFAVACAQELAGCDVLYERMSWLGSGGGFAARQMGIPLVIEYNGDHLHDLEARGIAPQGLQRSLALRVMSDAVSRASQVIASGKGWRDHFASTWAYPAGRIAIVENGSDLVDLLPRTSLRAFQDQPAGSPVEIVYLGAFYPWHGVGILLEAFARLIQSGQLAHLTLIGSGDDWEATCSRVNELGLSLLVDMPGQLDPAGFAPRLAAADIGVSPYCGWKEYSGLKLFDYKAAGLAVIASGENGQPVTLQHDQTGWIVPPCDVDALAGALQKLAEDVPLRRRLGQAARLEAERCHSWDHTAVELEGVIAQVLHTHARDQ